MALTEQAYDQIKTRWLQGESITRLAREFEVPLGTISGRLSREEGARELRENIAETTEKAVSKRASKVAAAVGHKLQETLEDLLDATQHFTRLAKRKGTEAQSVSELKEASECYNVPARLVIDAFALARNAEVNHARGGASFTVNVATGITSTQPASSITQPANTSLVLDQ